MATRILSKMQKVRLMITINKILRHFCYILTLTILSCCININFAYAKKKSDNDLGSTETSNEIIELISSITCETQALGSVLFGSFTHTCDTQTFADIILKAMYSGGLSLSASMRLKINHEELFPNNCSLYNRIDPEDLKLPFALCSNILLVPQLIKVAANANMALTAATFTGQDPWEAFKSSWNIPAKDYHHMHLEPKGASGIDLDVSAGFFMHWKIIQHGHKLCLAVPSLVGYMPIGCKFIREPFPHSKYKDGNLADLAGCGSILSCSEEVKHRSVNPISISAPIIQCVRQMIGELLVNPRECNNLDGSSAGESVFHGFQKEMHKAVTAFLTIYVMLGAIRILLGQVEFNGSAAFKELMKLILVIYFSIGINMHGGDSKRFDGMTSWAFPVLFKAGNTFASWIINASTNGLCEFKLDEYNTAEDYQYLSLWDGLDCRVSHYLGLNVFANLSIQSEYNDGNLAKYDAFNYPIPPYLFLLIPGFYSGNVTLIMLALTYPIIIISVAVVVINSFAVSLITVTLLGIFAPIFVPMVLFEKTKGLYESWVQQLIGVTLQPMITVAFSMLLFAVYDFSYYEECQFNAELFKPRSDVTKKFFMLDINKNNYPDNEKFEICERSLGYMLTAPFMALHNVVSGVDGAVASTIPDKFSSEGVNVEEGTKTEEDYREEYSFLDSIIDVEGLFAPFKILDFRVVMNLIMTLLKAYFMLILMRNFSDQITAFAADLTQSNSLDGVTASVKNTRETLKKGSNMGAQQIAKMRGNDKAEKGSGEDKVE